MEENIFGFFLEGYTNVHNKLVDINLILSNEKQEIERLDKIIEANNLLVESYMDVKDVNSDEKEKRKEFEDGTKQYMDNIQNAEKEKENIAKKHIEKENLEKAITNIRENAKAYKEKKLEEENKKRKKDERLNKIYEFNGQEYKINQKLEKFKDREPETDQEAIEKIKLENELKTVQENRKKLQQELNQETDMSKKINKDYILFLGQLSLIDKNAEKVKIGDKEEEEKQQTENEEVKDEETKVQLEEDNKEQLEEKPEDIINDSQPKNAQEKVQQPQNQTQLKRYGITNIKIDEGNDIVKYTEVSNENGIDTEKENKYILTDLIEREYKKTLYKKLGIRNICKDITGGRISGLFLEAKVNPAIVHALNKDPKTLRTYIECLNNKTELPFQLEHNLRDSKLGIMDKLRMWVHAKAEDKIPGTKVEFEKYFWNKNKTLPSAEKNEESEKDKEPERNMREEVKVENKNNMIERKALETIKETEEQMAQTTKEIIAEDKNEKTK